MPIFKHTIALTVECVPMAISVQFRMSDSGSKILLLNLSKKNVNDSKDSLKPRRRKHIAMSPEAPPAGCRASTTEMPKEENAVYMQHPIQVCL